MHAILYCTNFKHASRVHTEVAEGSTATKQCSIDIRHCLHCTFARFLPASLQTVDHDLATSVLSGTMPCLSSLPDEVLKLLMQHVPLAKRWTSCCLVNRRFHAAAMAATAELALQYGLPRTYRTPGGCNHEFQHARCSFDWLSLYGQHVTCLSMTNCPLLLQQLPCPNLLELSLEDCTVQLGPAADQPGMVLGCRKLTRLELRCQIVHTPPIVKISILYFLPHLKELVIDLPKRQSFTLSQGAIPRLLCLTSLTVSSMAVENLSQLQLLTNLQELFFSACSSDPVGPSNLPSLPASLTKLMLLSPIEDGVLSLLPTGLQDLNIARV